MVLPRLVDVGGRGHAVDEVLDQLALVGHGVQYAGVTDNAATPHRSKPGSADTHLSLGRAAEAVRSWNAVIVVGAGLSRPRGFPTSPDLAPLVWQALDASRSARKAVARKLGRSDAAAKALIGREGRSLRAGYAAIGRDQTARRAFQHGFAQLNRDRADRPAPAHDAISELVHRGYCELVVSLNWDTGLEESHRRLYGHPLAVGGQYAKPHGNASEPDGKWVLPFERGQLPEGLLARVTSMASQRPRTLLIAGYSESDEHVVTQLISPLAERWDVVRIGPRTTGERDIALAAEEALPGIARLVAPQRELPGWTYVTFQPQRDIGAAIAGSQLGPSDVEACPAFREVAVLARRLEEGFAAVLVGPSGVGKSVTGFQAAYELFRKGWEVVELLPGADVPTAVEALEHIRGTTVAVVDDGQLLQPEIIHRLLRLSGPQLRPLILSTEEISDRSAVVRIAAMRAVRQIYHEYLARADEVLAHARKFDDHLGDTSLSLGIDRRLADASQQPTPWQFGFVLRGGWRTARDEFAALYAKDRIDRVACVIAAAQLASADAGIADRQLIELLVPWTELDADSVVMALEELRHRQFLAAGSTIRTPHTEFAVYALAAALETWTTEDRNKLLAVLQATLRSPTSSLVGIYWLLNRLLFVDDARRLRSSLIDQSLGAEILERCWRARDPADIGRAALVLNELRRWFSDTDAQLRRSIDRIRAWIAGATADSAFGLSRLMNDVFNDDRDLAREMCQGVDATHLLETILASDKKTAWVWGEFLGRLSVAGQRPVRQKLSPALDDRLTDFVVEAANQTVGGATNVVEAIAGYDFELALRLVEEIAPIISDRLSRDPAESWWDVQDVLWFVLGFAPGFLRSRNPNQQQRQIARRITRAIDLDRLTRALERSPRRQWQALSELLFFLREADARSADRFATVVSLESLDERSLELWETMPRDFEELVTALAITSEYEPARSWIASHSASIETPTVRLVIFAPEAFREHRGTPTLDLDVGSGWGWEAATVVISVLADTDVTLAENILRSNARTIAKGLDRVRPEDTADALAFLVEARRRLPEASDLAWELLDVPSAEQTWQVALRGKPSERLAARELVALAAQRTPELAALKVRLSARFPSVR